MKPKSKDYFKNVGKSIGLAGSDVLGDMVPNLKGAYSDNKEMIKEKYQSIKTRIPVDNGSDNGNFHKSMRATLNNALKELSTGKIYTNENKDQNFKNQAESMGIDSSILDDLDFDMDADFSNSSSDEEEKLFNDTKESKGTTTASRIITNNNTKAVMKTITNNNVITRGSRDVKNTNKILIASLQANIEATNRSTSALLNNISAISNFQQETTVNFYNDMSSKLTDIYNSLDRMTSIYSDVETTKYKSERDNLRESIRNNGLSMQTFADIFKYNTSDGMLAEFLDEDGFLGKMLGGEAKNIMSNPTGALLKAGVKKVIPKKIQKSLEDFDGTIGAMPENLQYMLNNWKNSTDTKKIFGKEINFKKFFGDKFGLDNTVDKKISTGGFNKGSIPYNGVANRAIVNVIPSLLSKILSAVTNNDSYKDELIYDYDKGKFTNKSSIKEETSKQFQKVTSDNMRSDTDSILKGMNSKDINDSTKKELERAMNEMARNGKTVSNYSEGSISKDKSVEKALRDYIKDPKNNNSFNKNIFRSTSDLQEQYRNFGDNEAKSMSVDYARGLYKETSRDKKDRLEKETKELKEKAKSEKESRKLDEELEKLGGKAKGTKLASVIDKLNETLTGLINRNSNIKTSPNDEALRLTDSNKSSIKDPVVGNKGSNILRTSQTGNMTVNDYNKSIASDTSTIVDLLRSFINGNTAPLKTETVLKGGNLDTIRNTISTDEKEDVNVNKSYQLQLKDQLKEEKENKANQDSTNLTAETLQQQTESRNQSFRQRTDKMMEDMGNKLKNAIQNSGIGQFIGEKKLQLKQALGKTKIGRVIGKFFSDPQAVRDAGMTPVYIMGSTIGDGAGGLGSSLGNLLGDRGSNLPALPGNQRGLAGKIIQSNAFSKVKGLTSKGMQGAGNLAIKAGGALGKFGNEHGGKLGNVISKVGLRTSQLGAATSNAGVGLNALTPDAIELATEQKISAIKLKAATLRETVKDKAELAWEAIKKKMNLATEQAKSFMQLSGEGKREVLRNVADKGLNILKKGWALATEGLKSGIEIMGSGIRAAATAVKAIPIAGPGLAIAGSILGGAALATLIAVTLKKLSGAKDKPPSSGVDGTVPDMSKKAPKPKKEKKKSSKEKAKDKKESTATTGSDDNATKMVYAKEIDPNSEEEKDKQKYLTKKEILFYDKDPESEPDKNKRKNLVKVQKMLKMKIRILKAKDETKKLAKSALSKVGETLFGTQEDKDGSMDKEKKRDKLVKGSTPMLKAGLGTGGVRKKLMFGKTQEQDKSDDDSSYNIDTYEDKMSVSDIKSKGMLPVWIVGSNVNTNNPNLNPSERAKEEHESKKLLFENALASKKNMGFLEKISFNIRGLVRGFTSLFKNGLGGGSGGSSNNSSSGGSGGYGTSSLDGNDNAEKIWNFFKGKGLTPEETAIIMGNIEAESGYDPAAIESNGEGHGLVQWSFGRKEALLNKAKELGVDWQDLGFQLDFMWEELNGPEKKSFDYLKGKTDIATATEEWGRLYERPHEGSANWERRKTSANEAFNKFKNNTGSGSSGGSSNTGSTIVGTGDKPTGGVSTGGNDGMTQAENSVVAAMTRFTSGNGGSLQYGQGNAKYPLPRYNFVDGGSADCSSWYAEALRTGANIPIAKESNTWSILADPLGVDVVNYGSGGAPASSLDESIMRPGDAILYDGHVEMYVGNGKKVGMGSSNGPHTSAFNTGNPVVAVRRFINKDSVGNTNISGGGSSSNGNSGGSSGSKAVFDSTYAVSDEEKAQQEADKYFADMRKSGKPIYKSASNDVKKGEKYNPNKDIYKGDSNGGWNKSDSEAIYDNLDKFDKPTGDVTNTGSTVLDKIKDNQSSLENGGGIWDGSGNAGTGSGGSGGGGTNPPIIIPPTDPDKPEPPIIVYPPNPDDPDRRKYFEELMKVLNLIEENTSNIPITNELLNKIIELLNKKNDTVLPNVNTGNDFWDRIDGDIGLIASGI